MSDQGLEAKKESWHLDLLVAHSTGGERSVPAGRDENLMRQAARLLAAAGGHRFRHYLVKVDAGQARCIEEFDPPRPKKLVV